ncbi:MAG: hypothetical protein K6G82_07555 [Ruminococcus sp.]|nr:hypothetical protein [Ruminococcus sp.]
MAISGSGTQADPYIVDNWPDFLTVSSSSSNYVKFANPHEEGGVFVLSGSGTSTDPYIVSTYEEMLFATGAIYTWQVKLIDRGAKKYKYGDIYCIYDDSLTTIDFNNIYPEGTTGDLAIQAYIDYNGWTLRNLILRYRFIHNYRLDSIRMTNTIIRNSSSVSSGLIISERGIKSSIFDTYVDEMYSSSGINLFYLGTTEARGINNCSVNLRSSWGFCLGYGSIVNSKISLDVHGEQFKIGSRGEASMSLNNCVLTGTVEATVSAPLLGYDIKNTIYDVEFIDKQPSDYAESIYTSFYNSDKISDTSALTHGLIPATTEQLKDAQWLYDRGFPIGVDS